MADRVTTTPAERVVSVRLRNSCARPQRAPIHL